jgi:hypothetical protein
MVKKYPDAALISGLISKGSIRVQDPGATKTHLPISLHHGEKQALLLALARIFHELASRDREDGCATGQPQGVGPKAYLNSTSQGPTPEDARKDTHIRGRSRQSMKYAGLDMEGSIFATDDGKAIRAARFLRVPFIITPKLVVELFRLQKISFKKGRDSLEKLGKIGRYSPEIIADALVSLMEEKNGKTNNHKNT